MNLSTADLRNYWTEFHETLWSYRYMFLVGPKVFNFVVKGVKVILKWRPVEIFQFWESIRDIIIYPHIKFWWYRAMLNFYHPFFILCFGSHFENGRHLEFF
jgi:hypothetical protein